jgi:hypothetical protein
MLYISSGFLGLVALSRFAKFRGIFQRSRPRHAKPDGHERASLRERNWYRKTNDERISTEKALR